MRKASGSCFISNENLTLGQWTIFMPIKRELEMFRVLGDLVS